jgi:hypothetical protein
MPAKTTGKITVFVYCILILSFSDTRREDGVLTEKQEALPPPFNLSVCLRGSPSRDQTQPTGCLGISESW